MMNNPEPINFLTKPYLLALYPNEMQLLFMFKSIVMDYPRLTDPIDKAATSLFIMHAEEAIKIEQEDMKKDFMFVKDFFAKKYVEEIAKDMVNVMQNPVIIQLQFNKMADAFNEL